MHKLRFFACFCLASAASNTFFNGLLDAESVARIFAEHAELRMLACGPCALEPIARLRRFGDLLAEHVRYEERVLFPQLQSHPAIVSAAEESI